MPREHNDRYERIRTGRRRADHAREFETVHAVQRPIENDDIGIDFAQNLPRGFRSRRFKYLNHAECAQDRFHELAHVRIVVNDKNFQTVEPVAAHRPARRTCGIASISPAQGYPCWFNAM